MGLEGTLLQGKYRLVHQIGEGGMGTVYEAQHEQIRRRVAVKVLSPELAHDPDAVARFRREAEAAGQIGHDNICEVMDFGIAPGGAPYLVMPLLRGRPLSQVIQEAGPMPVDRACDVVGQILAALSAAHGQGIVHRDLKPENVFVTRVGDRDDFVKVLDFGISKVLRGPTLGGPKKDLTRTGSVLGTPHYMAPEQARGAKDIDARVDIYATGVILYEMLTATRPFDGETVNEVLWKIWNQPVVPPRSLRHDLPADLERVVLTAMARERDDRFPTAEVFRQALIAAREAARLGLAPAVPRAVTASPTGAGATAPEAPAHELRTPRSAASLFPTPGAETVHRLTVFRRARRRRLLAAIGLAGAAVAGVVAFFVLREGSTSASRSDESIADAGRRAAAAEVAAPLGPVDRVSASPAAKSVGGTAESGSLPSDGDARPQMTASSGPHVLAADASPDAAASAKAGDTGMAESAAEFVHIILEGVPPGATVMVDGSPAPGAAFDVQRAPDRRVRVVVRADGYETWERRVPAATSATIPVSMRRTALASPHTGGGSAGHDAAVRPEATAARGDAGAVDRAPAVVIERLDAGRAARDGRGTVDGTVSTFGQMP